MSKKARIHDDSKYGDGIIDIINTPTCEKVMHGSIMDKILSYLIPISCHMLIIDFVCKRWRNESWRGVAFTSYDITRFHTTSGGYIRNMVQQDPSNWNKLFGPGRVSHIRSVDASYMPFEHINTLCSIVPNLTSLQLELSGNYIDNLTNLHVLSQLTRLLTFDLVLFDDDTQYDITWAPLVTTNLTSLKFDFTIPYNYVDIKWDGWRSLVYCFIGQSIRIVDLPEMSKLSSLDLYTHSRGEWSNIVAHSPNVRELFTYEMQPTMLNEIASSFKHLEVLRITEQSTRVRHDKEKPIEGSVPLTIQCGNVFIVELKDEGGWSRLLDVIPHLPLDLKSMIIHGDNFSLASNALHIILTRQTALTSLQLYTSGIVPSMLCRKWDSSTLPGLRLLVSLPGCNKWPFERTDHRHHYPALPSSE